MAEHTLTGQKAHMQQDVSGNLSRPTCRANSSYFCWNCTQVAIKIINKRKMEQMNMHEKIRREIQILQLRAWTRKVLLQLDLCC